MSEGQIPCLLRRDVLTFERGLFDGACDACFVIACCGVNPSRTENMMANLQNFRPLRRVEIFVFEGHRACPGSQSTAHDLMRNYYRLFQHALSRSARRILVLEDDFEVRTAPLEKDAQRIAAFLEAMDPDVYGLGNFFVMPTPSTLWSYHQQAFGSCLPCSQACFYGEAYMRTIVDYFPGGPSDVPSDFWAVDWWPFFFSARTFRYRRPIVMQTFPQTENQSTGWAVCIRGLKLPSPLLELCVLAFKKLEIHERPQPGWDILYFLSNHVLYPALACVLLVFVALCVLAARALFHPADAPCTLW